MNNQKPLHIKIVLKGKPPQVQFWALFLVSIWMITDTLLLPAKNGERADILPESSLIEHEFYSMPLTDFLDQFSTKLENISDFPTELKDANKHLEDKISGIETNKCHPLPECSIEDLIQDRLDEYKFLISPQECSEKEKKEILDNLWTPEFSFLGRVFFPCLYFYTTLPYTLFNNAINGDIESLQKLLRLDKSLITHPEINKQIVPYWKKNKHIYENLIDSLKSPISGKYSKRFLKYQLSGLLALLSETLCNYHWNEKTLRELFDAISVDHGPSEQIDEDLPASTDTFRKAISFHQKEWKKKFPRFFHAPNSPIN